MSENLTYKGGCLCGQVKFQFSNPERRGVACHCKECRQSSGHFVVATNVKLQNFEMLNQAGLKWYASSDFAKRAFCVECGSQLFYKMNEADKISVMMGTIEDTHQMEIDSHIFCAEKGDYYQLTDDTPCYDYGD